MASSKLEMSLDDIIKQTKKTERTQKKVGGSVRKSPSKKTSIGLARKNKRIGRQRVNVAGKNKQMKNIKPVVNQRKNVRAGLANKRRNGVVVKNKPLTTAATMNLVKKLVKKALTQTNTIRPIRGGIRGKFNNRNGNPRILGRSPLNRINQRSRVIGNRQRILAPIPMPAVRGRGNRIMVPVMETIPAVRRIRYVPQRVANNNFGGMMGQVVRNNRAPRRIPQQQQQRFSTIREQINALRQGSARTQNRQQFLMVQQQPRFRPVQQQQFRRRQQPQQRQQQQFVRQRKQTQGQQVGGASAFYDPPNYLQRIPTQQINNRRFMGNF